MTPTKRREYSQRYYKKHRKAVMARNRKYYYRNRPSILKRDRKTGLKWRRRNSERTTVKTHHRNIFSRKSEAHRFYKDIPFFDDWNPDKGGSFKAGADWIISNLGKRPKGCSLHICDHSVGFWPGNLEWTHPTRQNNQQMFKIIAQLRHRIKQLEVKLEAA